MCQIRVNCWKDWCCVWYHLRRHRRRRRHQPPPVDADHTKKGDVSIDAAAASESITELRKVAQRHEPSDEEELHAAIRRLLQTEFVSSIFVDHNSSGCDDYQRYVPSSSSCHEVEEDGEKQENPSQKTSTAVIPMMEKPHSDVIPNLFTSFVPSFGNNPNITPSQKPQISSSSSSLPSSFLTSRFLPSYLPEIG